MNLKTLSLTLLASAAMLGAQAQNGLTDAQMVTAKQAHVAVMTSTAAEELQLDADQIKRMEASDEKYATSLTDLRTQSTDLDVIVKKSEDLYRQHEQELSEILGEEKYRKLNEWRKAKSSEGMKKMQTADPKITE